MTKRTKTKEFGAYYTDPSIARFLVNWAIRNSNNLIFDPSFGHGVFLDAALEKLGHSQIGGSQIYGVEIHPETHSEVTSKFSGTIPGTNLLLSDFFNVSGGPVYSGLETPDLPSFDAVVGNPPFIRYHRWKGKTRKRAQEKAKESGVELNGLSSSWAPFVIYATSFLKNGGNFAMVLPGEILHAAYARPVIEHLWKSFETISIVTFQKKLFSNLSEDAVLVLCERMNYGPGSLRLIDLHHKDSLNLPLQEGVDVEPKSITTGSSRLIEYLLPRKIRGVYNHLKSNPEIVPFGELADIGIGYVTGNNDYFHLTIEEATTLGIPSSYLSYSVRSGRDLSGLIFTKQDFQNLLDEGRSNLLLDLQDLKEPAPDSISKYIIDGERRGISDAYKCRVRKPWYIVPHIRESDGFLTYMSGKRARLVVNKMGAYATNTLHTVSLRDYTKISMFELSISWLTSLTTLSTEIEGHSMGGGLLKLEPSEARQTLIGVPYIADSKLKSLSIVLDQLIRKGEWQKVNHLADEAILIDGLGLSHKEVELLREGAKQLQQRRYQR